MMALSGSVTVLAQEVEVSSQEVSSMSMPQTSMISGTFNDYFPDAELAKVVARALKKEPTDSVTLWELQEITKLSFYNDNNSYEIYSFTGNSIDFKNIGYLMNLEHISFNHRGRGSKHGTIDLKFYDDVLNCKKLTTISADDTPIIIPDILVSSSLKTISINQEYFSPIENAAILNTAILEKFNKGELQIHYSHSGAEENLYIYERGSEFDIRNLLAPTNLQTIPKIATQVGCIINDRGNGIWWNINNETFDQFLDRINEEVLKTTETNETFSIKFYFNGTTEYGSTGINITLPIEVVKGPVKKDLHLIEITFMGTPIQIQGQIKGKFDNGSHILDRETINAQKLTITANGETFDSSTIVNMQISVINDQIAGGTIVGQVNGQFYSIMF